MPSASGFDVCHCGIGQIVSRASAWPQQQLEANAMAVARTSCINGALFRGMKDIRHRITSTWN